MKQFENMAENNLLQIGAFELTSNQLGSGSIHLGINYSMLNKTKW